MQKRNRTQLVLGIILILVAAWLIASLTTDAVVNAPAAATIALMTPVTTQIITITPITVVIKRLLRCCTSPSSAV